MATPLYKKMKNNGTTLYVFPSAAYDDNLSSSPNSNYKLNFSKFVCLNLPKKENKKLDFNNTDQFQSASYLSNSDFADSMINSLRNYVANADTTYHESRTGNYDFYNIQEITTPTEMLFWKWLRKLNVIDLEPAQHNIDWDKHNEDFINTNQEKSTDNDYFREYLWKERETIEYISSSTTEIDSVTREYEFEINNILCKFRVGDDLIIDDVVKGHIKNVPTDVNNLDNVTIDKINNNSKITVILDSDYATFDPNEQSHKIVLDYDRLIQYIGEIGVESYIQTGKMNHREISAYIQNHNGQTPTVLFKTINNLNYYPNLEVPIMDDEKISRIVGSDNFNSPIITNPSEYPGSFYGIYDKDNSTADFTSTYKTPTGDSERKNGDYYGILLKENTGIYDDSYFEELNDFDSRKIDGLKLDFDINHYYKAKFGKNTIFNFDDFNSTNINGEAPKDFDFNVILWYYTLDNGKEKTENLYGIEFINNPNNDFDDSDNNGLLISPNHKYVSNGEQDGVCYTYTILSNIDVDNTPQTLAYNPEILNNSIGFDLYNNVLKTNISMYDNFQTILSNQERYDQEIEKMKSLVYTQTNLQIMNSRIDNLDKLLRLYSKMQMVDSETINFEVVDDGNYPKLKAHLRQKEYSDVLTYSTTKILDYNNNNKEYFPIDLVNKPLIFIKNDIKTVNANTDNIEKINIIFNRDLSIGESFEVILEANESFSLSELTAYINFEENNLKRTPTELFKIKTPIDIKSTEPLTYTNSKYSNVLLEEYATYLDTIDENKTCKIWSDILHVPLFETNDVVYVDNLFIKNNNTGNIVDYSGVYKIIGNGYTNKNFTYYEINLDSSVLEDSSLTTYPKITYYKGMKFKILRVDGSIESNFKDRYRITKEILN